MRNEARSWQMSDGNHESLRAYLLPSGLGNCSPVSSCEPAEVGEFSVLSSSPSSWRRQCEALRTKCEDLEALNTDMQAHVQKLTGMLQARELEIEKLKENHALSFAVGRLPGHLPGCRSCAARDALINDLRQEVSRTREYSRELQRTQEQLNEVKDARRALTEDLAKCRAQASQADLQQREHESRLAEQLKANELLNKMNINLQQDEADYLKEHARILAEKESMLAAAHHRERLILQKLKILEESREYDVARRNLAGSEEICAKARYFAQKLKDDLEVQEEFLHLRNELDKELTRSGQQREHVTALATENEHLRTRLQAQQIEHIGETSKLRQQLHHVEHQLALAQLEKDLVDRCASTFRCKPISQRPHLGFNSESLDAFANGAGISGGENSHFSVWDKENGKIHSSSACELLHFIHSLDVKYGAPCTGKKNA